jgi:hypothetical protein
MYHSPVSFPSATPVILTITMFYNTGIKVLSCVIPQNVVDALRFAICDHTIFKRQILYENMHERNFVQQDFTSQLNWTIP